MSAYGPGLDLLAFLDRAAGDAVSTLDPAAGPADIREVAAALAALQTQADAVRVTDG